MNLVLNGAVLSVFLSLVGEERGSQAVLAYVRLNCNVCSMRNDDKKSWRLFGTETWTRLLHLYFFIFFSLKEDTSFARHLGEWSKTRLAAFG